MSTLMSKDLFLTRPSSRVLQAPGGASQLSFGDDNVPIAAKATLPPPPTTQVAATPAPAAVTEAVVTNTLAKVEISPSSKSVGLAIATPVGGEFVTTALATALASKGITNVVVSQVTEPAILPFLVKNMVSSCAVVLAVAVLTNESSAVGNPLSSALLQIGLEHGSCPVIPGVFAPASLLELKGVMPNHAGEWSSSISRTHTQLPHPSPPDVKLFIFAIKCRTNPLSLLPPC